MKSYLFIISLINVTLLYSQNNPTLFSNTANSNYQFTTIHNLDANPVNNQGYTGTCWSFSALSFFESEILREKKERIDLAEMFIVRNAAVFSLLLSIRFS